MAALTVVISGRLLKLSVKNDNRASAHAQTGRDLRRRLTGCSSSPSGFEPAPLLDGDPVRAGLPGGLPAAEPLGAERELVHAPNI